MVVTRRDLETLLAELADGVEDPRAGLFGPRSLSWRVNREAVLLAGGGRAALMQLAHPAVSHAIEQHSPTRSDPQGRFLRTFTHVFAMLFGDLPSTLEAARRVHLTHARIRGTITEPGGSHAGGERYAANDPAALLWVFATLVDTTLETYALLVRPLSLAERARYYAEARAFGQLFGLPANAFPPTYEAFRRYVADMLASDVLYVTAHARELSHFLLDSPSQVFMPLMHGYRVFTAGLLPARLCGAYGLPSSSVARMTFGLEVQALRTAVRALPPQLRFFPAYLDARRRMRGQGPDRVAHFLERLVIRNLPQAAR